MKKVARINEDFEVLGTGSYIGANMPNKTEIGGEYFNKGEDYAPFYNDKAIIRESNSNPNLKKNYPATTYNGKTATYDYQKYKEFDYVLDVTGEPAIQKIKETDEYYLFEILKPFITKYLGLDKDVVYFDEAKGILNGEMVIVSSDTCFQIDMVGRKTLHYKDGTIVEIFNENFHSFEAPQWENVDLEDVADIAELSKYHSLYSPIKYNTIVFNIDNLSALLTRPDRFTNNYPIDTFPQDIANEHNANFPPYTPYIKQKLLDMGYTDFVNYINKNSNYSIKPPYNKKIITYKGIRVYDSSISYNKMISNTASGKASFMDRVITFCYFYMRHNTQDILEAKEYNQTIISNDANLSQGYTAFKNTEGDKEARALDKTGEVETYFGSETMSIPNSSQFVNISVYPTSTTLFKDGKYIRYVHRIITPTDTYINLPQEIKDLLGDMGFGEFDETKSFDTKDAADSYSGVTIIGDDNSEDKLYKVRFETIKDRNKGFKIKVNFDYGYIPRVIMNMDIIQARVGETSKGYVKKISETDFMVFYTNSITIDGTTITIPNNKEVSFEILVAKKTNPNFSGTYTIKTAKTSKKGFNIVNPMSVNLVFVDIRHYQYPIYNGGRINW